MSLDQSAFIDRSRVPDRTALQKAIREIGFDLEVHESYRPFESEGFLPCVLGGKESGFEIYFSSTDEALENFPHLEKVIGTRDCQIVFVWGGDMLAVACVTLVSAALAKDFGAIVHYPGDDFMFSSDQLIEEAKKALQLASETAPQPTLVPLGAFEPSDTKKIVALLEANHIEFGVESDHSDLFRPGRTAPVFLGLQAGGSKLAISVGNADLARANELVKSLFKT